MAAQSRGVDFLFSFLGACGLEASPGHFQSPGPVGVKERSFPQKGGGYVGQENKVPPAQMQGVPKLDHV